MKLKFKSKSGLKAVFITFFFVLFFPFFSYTMQYGQEDPFQYPFSDELPSETIWNEISSYPSFNETEFENTESILRDPPGQGGNPQGIVPIGGNEVVILSLFAVFYILLISYRKKKVNNIIKSK